MNASEIKMYREQILLRRKLKRNIKEGFTVVTVTNDVCRVIKTLDDRFLSMVLDKDGMATEARFFFNSQVIKVISYV